MRHTYNTFILSNSDIFKDINSFIVCYSQSEYYFLQPRKNFLVLGLVDLIKFYTLQNVLTMKWTVCMNLNMNN